MTYYSTLKEAFNVDSFTKTKTKEPFMNDYSPQDDCYYKSEYGVDTKACRRARVVSNFTNPTTQTAQQFVMNKGPSSNNASNASNASNANNANNGNSASNNGNPAYIETSRIAMNSSEVSGYQSHQMNTQGNSCAPLQAPNYQYPISGECKKEFEKAVKIYTSDSTANNMSYDDYNKNSKFKDIQPYYDEDLEQYFNINNLNDQVKYKSNTSTNPIFMPNENKTGYTNDNTGEYRNMSTNENDNLLKTEAYNLSEEDKKNALQALSILKTIEDKINKNAKTASPENTPKPKEEPPIVKAEGKKTSSFYTVLINIGLFIFIGVVIILLCDQMVELAIQLGMKKAVNVLEPFMKMQEMQQQIQTQMQEMQRQIALHTPQQVPQVP